MTISGESRHRLHQRLEGLLGASEAGTLMDLLPPVGWTNVATKQDLAALEQRIGLRFAPVELRLDHLEARVGELKNFMHTELLQLRLDFRTSMFTVLSAMVTLVGAMIAAVKL